MVAEIKVPLATYMSLFGEPSPSGLWQLRGELLRLGVTPDASVWPILDEYYGFLNELVASATAREYSHFASLLDIGAVGAVALQNLLTAEKGDLLWQRVLAGGLSEGLMVLAARQYVKAWEGELSSLFHGAAWNLFWHLWHLSLELRPELNPPARRAHLDELLSPLRDEETGGTVKAALITRLYQLLLLIHLREPASARRSP
jgi:hypothetical protein